MKNTAFILWILALAFAISFPSFCGEVSVAFGPTPSPGVLATKDDIFLNASILKFMEIRMKTDKSYAAGRMFFRRIGDAGFNYYNSFEFQTGLNNMSHAYLIDLGRNPNWFGTVTQMALSPANSEGKAEIESVRFLEPTIWLAAKSLWQEFFTFEIPQMRTVNFIYGPKINGAPVNLYIYCLIFILSVSIILYALVKMKDPAAVFNWSSKKIIIICLAFWIALDSRILIDQARTVILDMQTLNAKTLDEKRASITLNDYYDFLHFSDLKIQKGSSFKVLHPSYYYYWDEKAAYYLSPRYISEKGDYILVYDPDRMLIKEVNEYFKKGYKTFATYKDGEYILKK